VPNRVAARTVLQGMGRINSTTAYRLVPCKSFCCEVLLHASVQNTFQINKAKLHAYALMPSTVQYALSCTDCFNIASLIVVSSNVHLFSTSCMVATVSRLLKI
jgi:hypothetical protein